MIGFGNFTSYFKNQQTTLQIKHKTRKCAEPKPHENLDLNPLFYEKKIFSSLIFHAAAEGGAAQKRRGAIKSLGLK